MIRSVIALHDLVLNKIAFKDVEEARDKEDKAKAAGAGAGAGESGGGTRWRELRVWWLSVRGTGGVLV